MSQIPNPPPLKPSLCFNRTALLDFLRLSRSSIDDTISQNLNALATPSATPFDPLSTRTRQSRTSGSGRGSSSGSDRGLYRQHLSSTACDKFRDEVLFPSWQARSDVLEYCAGVATSPAGGDGLDRDSIHDQGTRIGGLLDEASPSAVPIRRVVDDRLDPYGTRDIPRQGKEEILAALVRNERMVEEIVRARTWAVLGERCGSEGLDAAEALRDWQSRNSAAS